MFQQLWHDEFELANNFFESFLEAYFMKRLLAILATIVAVVSLKSVQADPWEGYYVGGFGGANFIQTNKKNHGHKNSYNTGYDVGGFIGYRWCEGLRLEGEISYRNNQHKNRKSSNEGSGRRNKGHLETVAYMANALYEIDLSCWDCCGCDTWEIVPYLGGGIGYSQQKQDRRCNNDCNFDDFGNPRSGSSKKKWKGGFAWQLIAGAAYEISPCMDVSLEYRFFNGHEKKLYNHSVGLAAKYHF